jgi:hypothetical protein
VVAGYSPIDKHTCHFARIATKMRESAWWSRPWFNFSPNTNGEVHTEHPWHGRLVYFTNAKAGSFPWR